MAKATINGKRFSPKELIKEIESHGVYVITELVTLLQEPDLSLELRTKILLELIQYGYAKLRSVEITDNRGMKDGIDILEQLKEINKQLYERNDKRSD